MGDRNESTVEKEERLDKVKDDVKEKGLSADLMKCMTVPHGGVCHRTSILQKWE